MQVCGVSVPACGEDHRYSRRRRTPAAAGQNQELHNSKPFSVLHVIEAQCDVKGFVVLQIANHSGYVQVDWKKVEKDVNKAKRHLKKNTNTAAPEINTFIDQVKTLYNHMNECFV